VKDLSKWMMLFAALLVLASIVFLIKGEWLNAGGSAFLSAWAALEIFRRDRRQKRRVGPRPL
jgi:uncharacterized membrane protein YjjP (DUF1212 family)